MNDELRAVFNSSFITHHSSFPLQLQAQAVELLHVVGLDLVGRGVAEGDAAGLEGLFEVDVDRLALDADAGLVGGGIADQPQQHAAQHAGGQPGHLDVGQPHRQGGPDRGAVIISAADAPGPGSALSSTPCRVLPG